MVGISIFWFAAILLLVLAAFRLVQAHVSSDSTVGHALAFILH